MDRGSGKRFLQRVRLPASLQGMREAPSNARMARMKILSMFTEHPATVGETYWQHLRSAMSFAWAFATTAVAVAVHALVPCLFVRTGREAIERLHRQIVTDRRPGVR